MTVSAFRTIFRLPACLAALLLAAAAPSPLALGGVRTGIAPAPPMGFNSWYINGTFINEDVVKKMADYLSGTGLRDVGYRYVVLDDGWTRLYGDPSGRDSLGHIVSDPTNFPSGIKALADYAHARGLKFGIYTEDTAREVGGFIGSAGHFADDAATYAGWGVDFIKFDVYSDDFETQVINFADAIDSTGRPMFLYTGRYQEPDSWLLTNYLNALRFTGDLTGGDLADDYTNVLYHIFYGASIPEAAGKDHWVDLDTFTWTDGKGGVSMPMLKTSFGMWSMLSAPLFFPAFLYPNLYPEAFSVVTNAEVIAIDQDAGAIQARCVATNGPCYVWVKPLGAADSPVKAVALMNTDTTSNRVVTVDWDAIDVPSGEGMAVRDLWERTSVGFATNSYSALVQAGSVNLLRLSPAAPPENLPVLAIRKAAAATVVSWPASPPGFVLETSPSLNPPDWLTVPKQPVTTGPVNSDALPASGSSRFYRLRY
jgi:alpha-galactosidase